MSYIEERIDNLESKVKLLVKLLGYRFVEYSWDAEFNTLVNDGSIGLEPVKKAQ